MHIAYSRGVAEKRVNLAGVATTGADVRDETIAFLQDLAGRSAGTARPDEVDDPVALRRPGGTFPAPVLLDEGVDREVPGRDGPVRVRVFTPPVVVGVYLHLHPGGGVLGSARNSDSRLWELAQAVSMAVVSVDYRLAPEYPFPAGPEDCIDVARWLVETSAATFGTTARVVGGESQGAYLAALVLLALREDPATRDGFAGAYLAYGPYDQSLTPSCRAYGDRNLVTSTQAEEWFRAQCYPGLNPEQRRDPAISPLYADLVGLPAARFVVGTNDPLLDDTLFMAARWRSAGNLAELDVVDAACHAFTVFPLTVAIREQEQFHAFLRERVAAAHR